MAMFNNFVSLPEGRRNNLAAWFNRSKVEIYQDSLLGSEKNATD